MGLTKKLIVAIFLSLLFGCAAGFSYRYYGLAQVSFEHGILFGPDAKDDLPFSACQPTTESRHPCIVMFTKNFFEFKQDYEDVKVKLNECERRY